MSDTLSNRRAIITGASRGLGKAIAQAYLEAGASLLLTAREPHALEVTGSELKARAAAGQKVIWEPCDVSVPLEVVTVVDTARRELGGLDILVNNAGVQGPIGPLADAEWNEWARTIEINLIGPAFCCRAVLPHFIESGYGKIVNLSGGGATGPRANFSAYAASKAGIVRLTETLAEEVKTHHIDVNAIAPGALNTRMLDEVLAAGADKAGRDYASALKQQESGGASFETAAALAVFLGSTRSDGITGRLLSAPWDPWRDLDSRREELASSDIYTLRRIVPKDRGKDWE